MHPNMLAQEGERLARYAGKKKIHTIMQATSQATGVSTPRLPIRKYTGDPARAQRRASR
jgi:hypothetical protein